jgi:preprotein translocase subunit SecG
MWIETVKPYVKGTWISLIVIMVIIVVIVILGSLYQTVTGAEWTETGGSTNGLMNILGNLSYLGITNGIAIVLPVFVIVSCIYGLLNFMKPSPKNSANSQAQAAPGAYRGFSAYGAPAAYRPPGAYGAAPPAYGAPGAPRLLGY